jgi:1,4-dihydroxy-2-naphthoate octaprenyltransferase
MNSSIVENPSKLNSWILAARPKTLLAAFVPVLVGSALAISVNLCYLPYSIAALVCAVLIQIGTNFTNDLYDHLKGADNKNRKGPQRALASGLISVKEMKWGITFTFGLSFLIGLYLVYNSGLIILIIGIISIGAGFVYTAGPFPLAYNGLGDLFVFIFFGIVGTMGTYYLHTTEFTFLSFLISLPVGAVTTNILVVNNFRDIDEDKSAGKNTLAVFIGRSFTRLEFILLLVLCYLVLIILLTEYNFSYWIFLPFITLPFAALLIKMLFKLSGTELNKTLELTAKFSGLFGLLFAAGLII